MQFREDISCANKGFNKTNLSIKIFAVKFKYSSSVLILNEVEKKFFTPKFFFWVHEISTEFCFYNASHGLYFFNLFGMHLFEKLLA